MTYNTNNNEDAQARAIVLAIVIFLALCTLSITYNVFWIAGKATTIANILADNTNIGINNL